MGLIFKNGVFYGDTNDQELKDWVETQVSTIRIKTVLEGDNNDIVYRNLPNSNREYHFTGGTVSSINFSSLLESKRKISDDYWALFVFPKAEAVSMVSDLVLNSEIKILNPQLDLSEYTVVHLLLFYDGNGICCIAAGY